MALITDPAMELANLCDNLVHGQDVAGFTHLSQKFEVEPWSLDFYRIVFNVVERANYIKDLVKSIPDSSHIADDAIQHIDQLLIGFQPKSMNSSWNSFGVKYINPANIQPIKMLSPFIRGKVRYPELSPDEINEILGLVEQLIEWLEDKQLSDNDFIRESLIEGLKSFYFRLERLRWLGWGYTVSSLRDVISAYMALERGIDASDPQATAIVKKTGSFIKKAYEKLGVAKDIADRGDFLIKAYGMASISLDVQSEIYKLLSFNG
jgi:hypothetical protein